MSDSNWKIKIDACRPGDRDLDLPEMADLAELIERETNARDVYARSQQVDSMIQRAIQEIPVPEGLEQRLLRALSEEASATLQLAGGPSDLDEPVTPASWEPTCVPDNRRPVRFRRRRRYAMLSAVIFACVVVISLLATRKDHSGPKATESFVQEVMDWTSQAEQLNWTTDFSAAHLQQYPFDPALRYGPREWAEIATKYDSRTVIYDLTPRSSSPATLFCMRVSSPEPTLGSVPPLTPFSTTGGISIGMWQRGGVVYVLVVNGNEERYRTFVQAQMVAIA